MEQLYFPNHYLGFLFDDAGNFVVVGDVAVVVMARDENRKEGRHPDSNDAEAEPFDGQSVSVPVLDAAVVVVRQVNCAGLPKRGGNPVLAASELKVLLQEPEGHPVEPW